MRRLPVGEFAVAVAFFLAAFAATSLSRVTETADVVWPGNALAAALLVRLPHVRWVPALLGILIAGIAGNWFSAHEALHYSAAMSVVNAIEIGTTWFCSHSGAAWAGSPMLWSRSRPGIRSGLARAM